MTKDERYQYEVEVRDDAIRVQAEQQCPTWTQLSKAYGAIYSKSEMFLREICSKHNGWREMIMLAKPVEKPIIVLTATPKQGFSQNLWSSI